SNQLSYAPELRALATIPVEGIEHLSLAPLRCATTQQLPVATGPRGSFVTSRMEQVKTDFILAPFDSDRY
ncbi:MAG TPA: hypothetical protein DCQ06_03175, partial [Myxococcales bacterium]|nr:hypothetical protein [Myxococcales bacterium]